MQVIFSDFKAQCRYIFGIQKAQCRYYLQSLKPNVGIICVFGSLYNPRFNFSYHVIFHCRVVASFFSALPSTLRGLGAVGPNVKLVEPRSSTPQTVHVAIVYTPARKQLYGNHATGWGPLA